MATSRRSEDIRCSFVIERAVAQKLKDLAWATGRSFSGVVEDAVRDLVQTQWQKVMDHKIAGLTAPGE
jgi:predicted transcriptional regulator